MLKKTISLAVTFGALSGLAWIAGCSSNNSGNNSSSNNSNSSTSNHSSSSGASSSNTSNSGSNSGSNSASSSSSGSGGNTLQIDDESASPGTSLTPGSALKSLIPSTDKIGTWYEYGSDGSQGTMGIVGTLVPNPFAFTALDAGQFPKAACVSSPGYTGYSAGIGLNFATLNVDSGTPPTESVDLSAYTGITFWGMSTTGTSVRVKFPDDQTDSGDPTAACKNADAGISGTGCDSAFFTPEALTSTWVQYTVPFALTAQDSSFGAQFTALDLKNIRQLQFEDEGASTADGGAAAFQFCIGPISLTK